jgi:hypothetical protein
MLRAAGAWYGGLSMLLAVIALRENVAPAPPLGPVGRRFGEPLDIAAEVLRSRGDPSRGIGVLMASARSRIPLRRRPSWGEVVGASVSSPSRSYPQPRARAGASGSSKAPCLRAARVAIARRLEEHADAEQERPGIPPDRPRRRHQAGPMMPRRVERQVDEVERRRATSAGTSVDSRPKTIALTVERRARHADRQRREVPTSGTNGIKRATTAQPQAPTSTCGTELDPEPAAKRRHEARPAPPCP